MRSHSFRSHLHAMDALVDVDGVLAGHHLIDGGAALLLLALLRCHLNTNTTQSGTAQEHRAAAPVYMNQNNQLPV